MKARWLEAEKMWSFIVTRFSVFSKCKLTIDTCSVVAGHMPFIYVVFETFFVTLREYRGPKNLQLSSRKNISDVLLIAGGRVSSGSFFTLINCCNKIC